jgi:hypothetical protein
VRRAKPCHSAAFLIDQYRRVGASNGGAQVPDQSPNLVGARAVAGKQDETPGIACPKQASLVLAENGPGNPDDRRGDRSTRSGGARRSGARLSDG